MKGEIAINKKHLDRKFWLVLRTLLHEMIHAWQQNFGKPSCGNYHNKQFRQKAAELGIVVNDKGHTDCLENSLFLNLLKTHNVDFDVDSESKYTKETVNIKRVSKLKKWSCGCSNIRVAKSKFEAKCLLCGGNFELCQ